MEQPADRSGEYAAFYTALGQLAAERLLNIDPAEIQTTAEHSALACLLEIHKILENGCLDDYACIEAIMEVLFLRSGLRTNRHPESDG